MPTIIIISGAAIVMLCLVIAISNYRFNRMVIAEINAIFQDDTERPARTFSHSDLKGLPEPLQKYLKRSLKQGQPYINCVRLKQSGTMRLAPDQPWKPFAAEQYFTTNPPAFIWQAKLKFMPFIWVMARDKYVRQQGNMLVKILSTITVVDAHGPKLASAAFIRFIAETMWFPTSLIDNTYLQWQAVNATSARAIANDNGVEATLTFHFDKEGDIAEVVSDERYKDVTDKHPTKWYGRIKQYKEFNGIRIPSEVEVGWELETGDFAYWQGNITDIDFNVPARY